MFPLLFTPDRQTLMEMIVPLPVVRLQIHRPQDRSSTYHCAEETIIYCLTKKTRCSTTCYPTISRLSYAIVHPGTAVTGSYLHIVRQRRSDRNSLRSCIWSLHRAATAAAG